MIGKLIGAGFAAATGATAAGVKKQSNKKKNNSSNSAVKTNTSYNGDFLTVDMNKDYTKLSQEAAAKGDYTSAARLEAMRNAKVNYMNSQGDNRYSVTNNYVKDYGYKNNQGGQVFTGNYDSISVLPDNWTTASIHGAKYTRDKNGNIYNDGMLVGDGVNQSTGELTFSNGETARKAALDRYIGTVGLPSGLSGSDSYDYITNKGLVDKGYIDAVQNGTVGEYVQNIERQVQARIDEENYLRNLMAQNQTTEEDDDEPVAPQQQQVLDNNSFETDMYSSQYLNDEYRRRKARQTYLMMRHY